MGESEHKAYLLDTNGFRYLTNPKENKHIKKAVKTFWKQLIDEIKRDEAIFVVPREVIRELEVQSYSLPGGEKQYARIGELLEVVEETLPDITTPEIEHQIRKISAYIGEEFRDIIKSELDVSKVKYGGVSDIRILYTAWQYECILVTGNIKDFVLFPLLFSPSDNSLFDIISGTFKKYSLIAHKKITSDPIFMGMMSELHQLIQQDE